MYMFALGCLLMSQQHTMLLLFGKNILYLIHYLFHDVAYLIIIKGYKIKRPID